MDMGGYRRRIIVVDHNCLYYFSAKSFLASDLINHFPDNGDFVSYLLIEIQNQTGNSLV